MPLSIPTKHWNAGNVLLEGLQGTLSQSCELEHHEYWQRAGEDRARRVHFDEITKLQRFRRRSRQPTFISQEVKHTGEKIMKRLGTYKGSRRSSPSPPHIHWIPKRAIRGVDSATYSAVRRLSSNLTSLKISMTNVAQRGRTLRLERKAINLARCPAFSCRSGPCGRRAPAENTSAGLYTQQG